jgi:hypothetical protein
MKRTFVALFVMMALVAGLFGSAMPSAAAGTTLSTDPVFVDAGNTNVAVAVKIDTDQQIVGWQMDVTFPSSIVTLDTPAGVSWAEDTTWLKAAALAAGGDTFRVAGSVSNAAPTGSLRNAAVSGLGFPAGTGATGVGQIAILNFNAIANGKAQLTFENVCLVLPNNTCAPGVVLAPSYIQVGPAPILSVSAISFSPTGLAGQQFKASITVANTASAAYPGGDPLSWSITNATGGAPASPVSLPAIGANDSYSFELTGFQLNSGAQNATLSVSIPAFGTSRNAVYSPVSDSGQTPVDATFGAFIDITPDTAINFGALALGPNYTYGNLNVKCNTSYQVDVYDNVNAWKMTEFNGTAYGSRELIESLHLVSAQHDVAAGTPAALVSGFVSGQSGDAGQDFPLTYSQMLRYADPLLPGGSSYHTVLVFNGYVTL